MMNTQARSARRRAFTLVEMMVVIAIIALLVAALLPAFSTVRNQAKRTQATALFSALDQGIRAFQGESALGGSLPPSHSDSPTNKHVIADPKRKETTRETVTIAGAHLLAQAMIGADSLNPPGFKDTGSGGVRDGRWWNDTHNDVGGIYELDVNTLQTKFPRYGGYVSDDVRERMMTLNQLNDAGLVVNTDALTSTDPPAAVDELMFVDPWEMPVLYYKANKGSLRMVCTTEGPGVYCQEDNGLITGSEGGTATFEGIDFGAGGQFGPGRTLYHAIAEVKSAGPDPRNDDLSDPKYDDTFTRFIRDPSQKARNKPVRSDSYLLISAGADLTYGTEDDITNWNRQTE